MMRCLHAFLCVLAAIAALAGDSWARAQSPAAAQPAERPVPRRVQRLLAPAGAETDTLRLLRLEKVQRELALNEAQKSRLKAIGEKLRAEAQERLAALKDLPQERRRQEERQLRERLGKRAEEAQAEAGTILLPHQRDRLRQIHLQTRGAAALAEPDVVKALGLTDEQVQKLHAVQADARTKRLELGKQTRGLKREELRKKRGEVRDKLRKVNTDAEQKSQQVLTPPQRESFEKLKGPKLELDLSEMREVEPPPGLPVREGPPRLR